MMKRIRVSVCFILTLVLMFVFTSSSAFAADTKTVTVPTTKVFNCTGPEISGNIQSVQSSSYYYDDGSYRGTLSFSAITSVEVIPVGKDYNNMDIYQVTVSVTYTGTVTSYIPVTPITKSVNITADRSFTCHGPEINANMQAITSSTYYYDDGAFRGTLNYSKTNNVIVTVIGHDYYGDIYQFDVNVDYSGTVTSY